MLFRAACLAAAASAFTGPAPTSRAPASKIAMGVGGFGPGDLYDQPPMPYMGPPEGHMGAEQLEGESFAEYLARRSRASLPPQAIPPPPPSTFGTHLVQGSSQQRAMMRRENMNMNMPLAEPPAAPSPFAESLALAAGAGSSLSSEPAPKEMRAMFPKPPAITEMRVVNERPAAAPRPAAAVGPPPQRPRTAVSDVKKRVAKARLLCEEKADQRYRDLITPALEDYADDKIDAAEMDRRKAAARKAVSKDQPTLGKLDEAFRGFEKAVAARKKAEEVVAAAEKAEDAAELKLNGAFHDLFHAVEAAQAEARGPVPSEVVADNAQEDGATEDDDSAGW